MHVCYVCVHILNLCVSLAFLTVYISSVTSFICDWHSAIYLNTLAKSHIAGAHMARAHTHNLGFTWPRLI
jgi:hypothetical protein